MPQPAEKPSLHYCCFRAKVDLHGLKHLMHMSSYVVHRSAHCQSMTFQTYHITNHSQHQLNRNTHNFTCKHSLTSLAAWLLSALSLLACEMCSIALSQSTIASASLPPSAQLSARKKARCARKVKLCATICFCCSRFSERPGRFSRSLEF